MTTAPAPRQATAASAHEALIATGILSAVVVLLIIIAGYSTSAGNGIVVMMLLMLLVQGITHANPFESFIMRHPLTPAKG